MQPATPGSKIPRAMGPTCPPETPSAASSSFPRRSDGSKRQMSSMAPGMTAVNAPDANIRPVGNGPHFTYSRPARPEDKSSNCSSVEPASDASSRGSPPLSVTSEQPKPTPSFAPAPPRQKERIVESATFTIEEMSDLDDGGSVVRPYQIEDVDSEPSPSRSRNRPEIDGTVMYGLGNLNCSDDSDETDLEDFQEVLKRRREAKRLKRLTAGSIGKRTISESIGSDDDREDLMHALDVNEAGSSARRLRRRIGPGDRRSLLFKDPPTPRIDEMVEPDSSDELLDGESLARELPYYDELEYISMEVDSPPP